MSIRPTERNETVYSSVQTPLTDLELKTKEAKTIYYYMILFIAIDYVVSALVIMKESYFFKSSEKNDINLFLIKFISLTVFFLFIVISLLFLNLKLTKIIRYIYIIVLAIYYLFEIVMNIRYFIQHFSKVDWMDMVFFLFILLTIIPRLFFFYNIDILIIKIIEIEDFKKGEEHDKLRQNLENKMERGDDTNWSKTSLPTERKQQSQFLAGANPNTNKSNKHNNDGNVYAIKENYIEEEKDNDNNNENNESNENDS